MFITWIVKALAALNSNARKGQVAAGMACGALLAMVPSGNLLWIALFVLTFFFKLHYGMQVLSLAVFRLAYPLYAPALDALGWLILNAPTLRPLFTALADAPIAPLTRFNDTLVAGGLAAGLALWLPLFLGFRALVAAYRAKLAPRIMDAKWYKAFMKIPLVSRISGGVASVARLGDALRQG